MSRKGENITKRKDGRWEARVIYAYSETGKAKYRYLYARTYTEVKAKKEHALSQIVQCIPKTSPNNYTVSDLASEFLLHKKATVKQSTMAHYENMISPHILVPFGCRKLSSITTSTVEVFAQELLISGKKNGKGLAPKTVKDILAILRSMFKYAASKRYMSADILDFSSPKQIKRDAEVLDKQEQKALESFALNSHDSYKLGVVICLYTGLRIGELCSLKWSDIDFKQSVLYVKRTIQRVSSKGSKKTEIIITEPKTASSIRTIPIPEYLLEKLKEMHSVAQCENAYILTGTMKYIEPSNYYMKYQRWLKKLLISHYSFHALRHTFATRCIESGFDAKSLSEILGHSGVQITMNRYVHPTLELKRQYMDKLIPLFQSNSGSAAVTI